MKSSMSLFPDGPVDVNRAVNNYKAAMAFAAMKETRGNKAQAAALLCLENYQALDYWLAKYGLKDMEWNE